MSLGPGSIAFVGFNADGNDNLAFVALETIAAGTQIHFSNRGWTGSGFGSGGSEIPLEIIQKFQIPGVPREGLRRELLIGSIVEEKNIGYFLAEKDAGVFFFPHNHSLSSWLPITSCQRIF